MKDVGRDQSVLKALRHSTITVSSSMDCPPSPTGSVASVASMASEAGGKAAKIPPAIAKAGKEDLQRMLVDALRKLRVRDKKLAEAKAELQKQKDEAGQGGGGEVGESAQLKAELQRKQEGKADPL
eukprot:jgi/Tetstr1/456397/TSEL_043131.t1